MLLCGLAVAALMLGMGNYVVSQGDSAGPDQAAALQAGEEIAVFRPLGRQQDNGENTSIVCTVTPQGDRQQLIFPIWQQRIRPTAIPATITCDQPIKVLTGSSITIATFTRGPLVAVPLFAAGVGAFLFFPRFTAFAASLSHPFGRLVSRITGRERNI